jgi:DNA-binding MarR family transcriptional regulator
MAVTHTPNADGTALRSTSLENWIESIRHAKDAPERVLLDAGAELLVDIVLNVDQTAAQGAAEQLRALLAKWRSHDGDDWQRAIGTARALLTVATVAASRMPSERALSSVGVGTHAHRMLRTLSERALLSGGELAAALGVDLTEVSRTARKLLAEGCVLRSKAAQQALWEITPRGREALRVLDARDAAPLGDELDSEVMPEPSQVVHVLEGEESPFAAWSYALSAEQTVAPEYAPLSRLKVEIFPTRETNIQLSERVIAFSNIAAGSVFTARVHPSQREGTSGRKVPIRQVIDTDVWRSMVAGKHSPVDRSRLLFCGLWAERHATVLERLMMWHSLREFAAGVPEFFIPDPNAGRDDVRSVLSTIFARIGLDPRTVWPASSLPLWDGFAIVPGREGRQGLVLFEAKSEPAELKNRLATPRTEATLKAFNAALNLTARELSKQRQRWHASPYADPVARLTMLRLMRDQNVHAWLYNIYFVDPSGEGAPLPSSRDEWESHISAAQRSLDLDVKHSYAGYVRHDFYMAPSLPLEGSDEE